MMMRMMRMMMSFYPLFLKDIKRDAKKGCRRTLEDLGGWCYCKCHKWPTNDLQMTYKWPTNDLQMTHKWPTNVTHSTLLCIFYLGISIQYSCAVNVWGLCSFRGPVIRTFSFYYLIFAIKFIKVKFKNWKTIQEIVV